MGNKQFYYWHLKELTKSWLTVLCVKKAARVNIWKKISRTLNPNSVSIRGKAEGEEA